MGKMKPETEEMFRTRSCHCGCGKECKRYYVQGHNDITGSSLPHNIGPTNHKHKHGLGSISKRGYCYKKNPINKEVKLIHRSVAERVLGKPLPTKSVIHHVDENPMNNNNNNLVICENRTYHQLLHQRMKALRISGHTDWIRCRYCGEYDDIVNLPRKDRNARYHENCGAVYQAKRKLKKKMEGEKV